MSFPPVTNATPAGNRCFVAVRTCIRQLTIGLGLSCVAIMLMLCPLQADQKADVGRFFEARIRPLLVTHCQDCHGADEPAANLRLDIRSGWERGGERGPAIIPGDPASSLLMQAVRQSDAQLKMPPEDSGRKLTPQQIDDLSTWIRQGAYDPRTGQTVVTPIEAAAAKHWAFQPVVPPTIEPGVHPIDFLIDRKLQENGFLATEPAGPESLIRRATYDLLGLPPTSEQLSTPREKFPELVRQLLDSPRYGERWGRHWLDVARYSDAKDGVLMYGDARIRPFAYTYRDYVIRAFNQDKPFDQFIREQLAADQLNLAADSPDLAAMGLLTLGRMFDRNRHDVIDDQIDVVSRGFLGLTVSCARCHDHKFDPVPTADYYSLYGVFASCLEPYERPRIGPVTEAGNAYEQEFSAKLQEVYRQQQTHYDATLQTARERTADYLVQVATTEPDVAETAIFFLSLIPDQLRPQITSRWRQVIARRAFPDDPVFGPWYDLMRDPVLKQDEWDARGVDHRIIEGLLSARPSTPAEIARAYGNILHNVWAADPATSPEGFMADVDDPIKALLTSAESPVWFPKEDVANYLSRTPGDAYRGLMAELDAIAVRHGAAAARAMTVVDSQILCDPVIFQRGDAAQRGTAVPRQFLKILSPSSRQPFSEGSGRKNLADAIASPDNPLTARVWVNRVWMHHFGEPLVENPGDFGLQTKPPVHLELLDYLADSFVRSGWSTKTLHSLIMSSKAWQRGSIIPDTPQMKQQLQSDASNLLIWHANRRRLDLEQMRDTLLTVSGRMDDSMYGRPKSITDPVNVRRTVYAFVERQNIPDLIQTFDFANSDTSTARRVTTTVPQQALFAMNSALMLDTARAVAGRVTATEPRQKVRDLYLLVYGREPSDDEVRLAAEFIVAGAMDQLAQILLMSNELMFVD